MNAPILTACLMAAAALAALFPLAGAAQRTSNFPTIGRIQRDDPALDQLIAPDAKIEVVASGFEWCEGPVWVKDGGYLLFSDIPRNSIMRWKEKEGLSVFLHPSGYTGIAPYGREPGSNANTLDSLGRVVSCEHGDRRISMLYTDGGKRTLMDNYQGKRLNSPNDLVFKSNGDLYFTDPPYGLPSQQLTDPRAELDFCGVYKLSPPSPVLGRGAGGEGSWKLTLLTKELTRPNGLAFSPDEKTFYVAQSDPERAIWMSFPVKADGTLGPGKVFADVTALGKQLPGLPDGMKIDRAGNLWATGPGGVHIYTPEGKHLGRIETGERCSNCAWGDDGSTLYITSDMYIVRIKTRTKGARW